MTGGPKEIGPRSKTASETDAQLAKEPFSLELAQRDFHGLFDEDMQFDEMSLAEAIRLTVKECGMDIGHRNFLFSLANSLDNPKAEWKLTLAHRQPGKFRSPADSARQFYRDQYTEAAVRHYTSNGMKTEAAVALLCEKNAWGRASVFKSLKRMRWIKQTCEELGLTRLARELAKSRAKNENG